MNRLVFRLTLVTALMSPCLPASADTTSTDATFGSATRALLDTQRKGAQASATAQPVTTEVAQRSYERYLNSFSQPIPAQFVDGANNPRSNSK